MSHPRCRCGRILTIAESKTSDTCSICVYEKAVALRRRHAEEFHRKYDIVDSISEVGR